MKYIELTSGKVAIVDDENYETLKQHNWRFKKGYAVRLVTKDGKKICLYMHREIMNTPKHLVVDHINLNGLDNRKENLRNCTHQQNSLNKRKHKRNTTGARGVVFCKRLGKFAAQIGFMYKHYHLGYFDNIEDAKNAYEIKSKELFGEFFNPHPDRQVGEENSLPSEKLERLRSTNKTGLTGVVTKYGKFHANITVNYKSIYLGQYKTKIEAAHAYNLAAIVHFKEKAILNKIDEEELKKYLPLKTDNFGVSNKIGFRGVAAYGNKFSARFKKKLIGVFKTALDAAKAYNDVATYFVGDKAILNIIPE